MVNRISISVAAIFLFLDVIISCSSPEYAKNRNQQVADLSYRSLSVSDSLKREIENQFYGIISNLSSEGFKLLYRETDKRTWHTREGSWDNVRVLRQAALDEWKSGKIESTMIIFPTTMTSPMNSRVEGVVGVEYEHALLTGTCMLILDKVDGSPIYFEYLERK